MAPKHFLTSNFRVAFEEYFNPEQQIRAVNDLKAHIAEVQNGSEEKRRELGVLRPQDTTAEQHWQDTRIAAHLDKCHWQLAQLYRYSKPCRIDEAEASLRQVINYARDKGAKRDATPELFLAVALVKSPEKEEEALSLFSSAFAHIDADDSPGPGPRSELWARASWARLLRRMDRIAEAEEQENEVVSWAVSHPLVFSPAKLQALVGEESDSDVLKNVAENPKVLAAIEQARERIRTRGN